MSGLFAFILLIVLGLVFGQIAERRHFKSILQREQKTVGIPVTTGKALPSSLKNARSELVSGNVVVSLDYFKKFVAAVKSLFGGQLRSYETLLERARREAILRMKESAIRAGGSIILNVRVETASIYRFSENRYSVGSVEVFAYGTAIIRRG